MKVRHDHWLRTVAASTLATLFLTACGGGESAEFASAGPGTMPAAPSPVPGPAPTPPANPPAPGARPTGASNDPRVFQEQLLEATGGNLSTTVASVPVQMPTPAAVRFLNQATFGATDADIADVRRDWRIGWMRQQYALAPSSTHVAELNIRDAQRLLNNPNTGNVNQPPASFVDHVVWHAYMTAPDQLRKRVGYALSQIFVVSTGEAGPGGLPTAGFLDLLERNAFGNFRTLLEEVTLSPAMGYYLSHRGNRKADYPGNNTSQPPLRVPDENYAREIMQLFTIGVVDLNLDGSTKKSGGQDRETYAEEDVQGLARVFTGYDYDNSRSNRERLVVPMTFNAARHSPEAKSFLGQTIPAGTSGPQSLKIALDVLFNHPNTAPFISKQLIQRLVTSNPSPAYVRRVATAFVNNGQGVRGDMKAVLEAVLLDNEAMDPRHITAPGRSLGKLREPVLRFTTVARALGADKTTVRSRVQDQSNPASGLGQSPLRSPSVFNFYRPGYVPPNTQVAAAGLVGPEFQITTDSSLPGFVNFINGHLIQPKGGLTVDLAPEVALADNPSALVARLNLRLTNNTMRPATVNQIVSAVTALPGTSSADKLTRARTAVLMAAASPEFTTQK